MKTKQLLILFGLLIAPGFLYLDRPAEAELFRRNRSGRTFKPFGGFFQNLFQPQRRQPSRSCGTGRCGNMSSSCGKNNCGPMQMGPTCNGANGCGGASGSHFVSPHQGMPPTGSSPVVPPYIPMHENPNVPVSPQSPYLDPAQSGQGVELSPKVSGPTSPFDTSRTTNYQKPEITVTNGDSWDPRKLRINDNKVIFEHQGKWYEYAYDENGKLIGVPLDASENIITLNDQDHKAALREWAWLQINQKRHKSDPLVAQVLLDHFNIPLPKEITQAGTSDLARDPESSQTEQNHGGDGELSAPVRRRINRDSNAQEKQKATYQLKDDEPIEGIEEKVQAVLDERMTTEANLIPEAADELTRKLLANIFSPEALSSHLFVRGGLTASMHDQAILSKFEEDFRKLKEDGVDGKQLTLAAMQSMKNEWIYLQALARETVTRLNKEFEKTKDPRISELAAIITDWAKPKGYPSRVFDESIEVIKREKLDSPICIVCGELDSFDHSIAEEDGQQGEPLDHNKFNFSARGRLSILGQNEKSNTPAWFDGKKMILPNNRSALISYDEKGIPQARNLHSDTAIPAEELGPALAQYYEKKDTPEAPAAFASWYKGRSLANQEGQETTARSIDTDSTVPGAQTAETLKQMAKEAAEKERKLQEQIQAEKEAAEALALRKEKEAAEEAKKIELERKKEQQRLAEEKLRKERELAQKEAQRQEALEKQRKLAEQQALKRRQQAAIEAQKRAEFARLNSFENVNRVHSQSKSSQTINQRIASDGEAFGMKHVANPRSYFDRQATALGLTGYIGHLNNHYGSGSNYGVHIYWDRIEALAESNPRGYAQIMGTLSGIASSSGGVRTFKIDGPSRNGFCIWCNVANDAVSRSKLANWSSKLKR